MTPRDGEDVLLPQPFRARALFPEYQVQFYETIAVPESLLEELTLEEPPPQVVRSVAQWRVDFPIRPPRYILEDATRQVLTIVEKILLRGRLTLLSPRLENALEKLFRPRRSLQEAFLALSRVPFCPKHQNSPFLASDLAAVFYREIAPQIFGSNFRRYVIPQVELTSLVPVADVADQQVDFVLFHPERAGVVVDIEKSGSSNPEKRDALLRDHGYTVFHIPQREIQARKGPKLSELFAHFGEKERPEEVDESVRCLMAFRIAQRMQIALCQALLWGFLDPYNPSSWNILTDLHETGLFSEDEARSIGESSIYDFVELFKRVATLYDLPVVSGEPLLHLVPGDEVVQEDTCGISFAQAIDSQIPTFFIQDCYVPFPLAHVSSPTGNFLLPMRKPEREELEYFLSYIFRKPSFREGQYEGITRVLEGKDVLLLLPTGAGKSLVYQLSSFLLPGVTIVIDPIISLMEDQIDNLSLMGIDRCIAITSQIETPEKRQKILDLVAQGEYLFVFIAPERFQTVEFREALRSLTVHTPVALIVVDEAHCVSEWGHDFRTAYLNIGRTSREYCRSGNRVPPLVALTGTASRAVLKDIQRELRIDTLDAVITPKTFDRPELRFAVLHVPSQEKMAVLEGYLSKKLPTLFGLTPATFYQARGKGTYAGLVFCPHVNGPLGVQQVAREIRNALRIPLDTYSGKEPKRVDPRVWRLHKKRATRAFKRNRIPLLVCTKAFGMGIDKPNIRYTVHLGVPPSIEAFYQEAGRAGRDRNPAYCTIIVSIDDMRRAERLLDPNTSVEEIDRIVRETGWNGDDVTHTLYFHARSFRGIAEEKRNVAIVLSKIPDLERPGSFVLSIPEEIALSCTKEEDREPREVVEKAIYRLLLVGVLSDYTIDYATKTFTLHISGATKEEIVEAYGKYVAGYLTSRRSVEMEKLSRYLHLGYRDFVLQAVELLLHFLYDVIEKGRRRAFYEMLLACRDARSDQDIRQRILRYLETTWYSEALEELVRDESGGLVRSMDIFDSLNSLQEIAELRGQVSRYLESYPDHPALLMLRSLTEAFASDGDDAIAWQNFKAAIVSAKENYQTSENALLEFAIWATMRVFTCNPELARRFVRELAASRDRHYLRSLLMRLPASLADEVAWILLGKLGTECLALLQHAVIAE